MDEYLSIICKKPFTFHRGKIVTDFSDDKLFKPTFYEGEVYLCCLEDLSCIWVRNDSTSKTYGPGARFTYEDIGVMKHLRLDKNVKLEYPLYTDYFYSLVQSKRELRIRLLGI
jgi:hypothetical protein